MGLPDKQEILGLEFSEVTMSQVVSIARDRLARGVGTWLVPVNVDCLRICCEVQETMLLVRQADLIVADGAPIVWASAISGSTLPQRVAGSDLVGKLAKMSADHGSSVFFLGGRPDSAEQAAKVLAGLAPSLKVAGWDCPPHGFEDDPDQMDRLIELLTEKNPGVVFVALGFPKQEIVINHLRSRLPKTCFIGVGGSLELIAGDIQRAPAWMQVMGLEWAYRLIREPGRLARRYLIHDLPFAVHLFSWAAVKRLKRALR